jgi:CRISPR-associated endonuclease/helicase Cas3
MMVTFVSQCEKKALNKTRRVLDAFADRIGDNTWQTVITQEGLLAVKKLLRKSASKNTAVSCHWIRSRSRTELVWVVGKRTKFDLQGRIPVNRTSNVAIKTEMDISWNTAPVIALLAGIAGLFHDVGKANLLFQDKLFGSSKQGFEPYRHEWISLRIFEAFVKGCGKTDQDWLQKLSDIQSSEEKAILATLEKDNLLEDRESRKKRTRPFADMPPVAQAVAWLIVSHHRLPKYIPTKHDDNCCPPFPYAERWLNDFFGWDWNSRNAESEKMDVKAFKKNWEFKNGTPIRSRTWRAKARELAKRALKNSIILTSDQSWLEDRFTSHIARLVLMLSDHVYSAGDTTQKWQDESYECFANTDRQTRERKQKLDEHNIGVAHNAYLLAKGLSSLRRSLPSLARVKGLESKASVERFRWQNQAFDLAASLKSRVQEQGFFGTNMASTGCGKTLANARIMYALADLRLGCRVSIALGLRTLTQQTGDALTSLLGLADDDIATLIGSQAIKKLHELHQQPVATSWGKTGSASAEALVDDNQVIRYEGEVYDGRLKQWLGESPRLNQLLSAPIMVSTIDHLMPATEGERGGKQIAPMLRLLTSDLILDEPDDFDQADIPALCRLVNWAGMLGSNVLISSATLPPSQVAGLFDAYLAGRAHYNRACGAPRANIVNCAWFDETLKPEATAIGNLQSFREQHANFVNKRCKKLAALPVKRRAALLNVNHSSNEHKDIVESIGAAVAEGIDILHQRHHVAQPNSDKKVSIGLVRMANINPLVAVAQYLLKQSPKENCRIHFCIYHSRHPLIVRSRMERILDSTLSRHDENAFWQQSAITNTIKAYPEKHHIFVVFATAVAEVGRDHDYDWAIVEPSSMRSIIQLAGRVWRHRAKTCEEPNILVLDNNYRGLRGEGIAFTMPGFESRQFPLDTHELSTLLEPQVLESISAMPRIQVPEQLNANTNLVHLEHASLEAAVFGMDELIPHYAARWWQQPLCWNAELQRHTRFRQSRPDDKLVLLMDDEQDDLAVFIDFEDGTEPKRATLTVEADWQYPERVTPWMDLNIASLLAEIVERQAISWRMASRLFTEMRVDQSLGEFTYAPDFGVYRTLR